MNKNIKRNNYRIDKQNDTSIFEIRNSDGNRQDKFTTDLDDLDIFTQYTWNLNKGSVNNHIVASNGTSALKVISNKYTYANSESEIFLARLDKSRLNYCKTNLVCVDKRSCATKGQPLRIKPIKNKSVEFIHAYYSSAQGGVYAAIITVELKGVFVKNVRRSFSDVKYSHAKVRAIYRAHGIKFVLSYGCYVLQCACICSDSCLRWYLFNHQKGSYP